MPPVHFAKSTLIFPSIFCPITHHSFVFLFKKRHIQRHPQNISLSIFWPTAVTFPIPLLFLTFCFVTVQHTVYFDIFCANCSLYIFFPFTWVSQKRVPLTGGLWFIFTGTSWHCNHSVCNEPNFLSLGNISPKREARSYGKGKRD